MGDLPQLAILPTLARRRTELASSERQLELLDSVELEPASVSFDARLAGADLPPLAATGIETFQLNLGKVESLLDSVSLDRNTHASEDQTRAAHSIAGVLAMAPQGRALEIAQATEPSLSADGRYLAFVSARSDLLVGWPFPDNNAQVDAFRKDRQTNQIDPMSTRVDRLWVGSSGVDQLELAASGRFAFLRRSGLVQLVAPQR